jgi:hypothetical protein
MSSLKIVNLNPEQDSIQDIDRKESDRIYGGANLSQLSMPKIDISLDFAIGGPILINEIGKTNQGRVYSHTSLAFSTNK